MCMGDGKIRSKSGAPIKDSLLDDTFLTEAGDSISCIGNGKEWSVLGEEWTTGNHVRNKRIFIQITIYFCRC